MHEGVHDKPDDHEAKDDERPHEELGIDDRRALVERHDLRDALRVVLE